MPDRDDQPVQQELLFEDSSAVGVTSESPPVVASIESLQLGYVQQFCGMLAPTGEVYAYAGTIFDQVASKVSAVRGAFPSLMSVPLADLLELARGTSELLRNRESADHGEALGRESNQPDTEGRAHYGSRREHPLSVILWDAALPGYQSITDAFGVMLVTANAAATPGVDNENRIPIASSHFRRALGKGTGVAKLAGNMLQRVGRALESCSTLLDVYSALCELRDDFPDEEGLSELVSGMRHILALLPKFASGEAITAAEGDVQLPRLFMRINRQNSIDVAALDKALYEKGSILEELDERSRRNEPMSVDIYRAFTPIDCSKSTHDLVESYLSLELEYGSWGWAAGLEKIRPGSRDFLSEDCRYRIGTFFENELESGSPSVGGLIFLLIMCLNKSPEEIYDTPCGYECTLQPDGKIRCGDMAIPISGALERASSPSVKHAIDSVGLQLPSVASSFVEKLLGDCKWGDAIGRHLNMPKDEFVKAFKDKVEEIKVQEHIHELRVNSIRYQLGRYAYTGCRSTVVVNALFGKDSYLHTNCAHYVWVGIDPLSDWFRDTGDAYFRGDDAAPVLDFNACASSALGIGASIPDIQHLRKLIQSKMKKLTRKRKKRGSNRIAYFNELAQFVQFLLQCVTGCHENTDAFAYFSVRTSKNANFTTLADKVSHYFDDGRLVFFTDVLRKWVKIYQAELSQLVSWIEKRGNEESAEYLKNLLGSIEYGTRPAIPHFILIDEGDLSIQSLNCEAQRGWLGEEYLWEKVDEIRKVLGTYLFESGISQELVNVQMGHVIGGVHSFNDEAFWCVSEALNAITPCLERFCREIGITSPSPSMREAYLDVGAYDENLEQLWTFAEDSNSDGRASLAEEKLTEIRRQLEKLVAGKDRVEFLDADIQMRLLQDISERLSNLKKYNVPDWGAVVAEMRALVKELGLEKKVRKISRVEKASTLSGHDFALHYDGSLDLINRFHLTLGRKPCDEHQEENYELLVDLFLLQVSAGALINYKLFDLCMKEKFHGLRCYIWLAYWDVYPTESKLRPMRVVLAPLPARVLEVLANRLPNKDIAAFDFDVGRLKRRIHVRLKSLGIDEKSYKKSLENFMNGVSPYWRFHLPPQVLDYYRKPYSVTPTSQHNLCRIIHSGRIPPVDQQVVNRVRAAGVLQPLSKCESMEEIGCSLVDHVSASHSVVDGVLEIVGGHRKRDSAKIKEARRLLERSSTFEKSGITVLHPISHAAIFSIQSFLTNGILKKRIVDGNYPSWNAILRYWEVIKKLASLQASLDVDLKDPQALSNSIRAVIENDGKHGKQKAARSRKTDSAGLLNYAVSCMDESLIATVNPDVFESLGGDYLPSASSFLTTYERDQMLKLISGSMKLGDHKKNRLLLYMMLHFEGLRDEEILEARPSDVLITMIDGRVRWLSFSARYHDGYTPKNTQSNGRVCRSALCFSETRCAVVHSLSEWLEEMQSKGVERIFYDVTSSGLQQSEDWLHSQIKVIAREFLGDPSFSGHQARHSRATEDGVELIIVNGSKLSDRIIENTIDVPIQTEDRATMPDNWIVADPNKLQSVSDILRHNSTKSTWMYYFSIPEVVLYCYLFHITDVDVPNVFLGRISCGRHERNSTIKSLVQKTYPSAVVTELANSRGDREKLPFYGPSEEVSIPVITRVLMAYAKGKRSIDVVVRSERVSERAIRRIIETAARAEITSAFCFYHLTGETIPSEKFVNFDSSLSSAQGDFSHAENRLESFLSKATNEELSDLNASLRIWAQENAHTEGATRLQVVGVERLQVILHLLDQIGQNLGRIMVLHGSDRLVDRDDWYEAAPLLRDTRGLMCSPHPSWVTRGDIRHNVFVVKFTTDRSSVFRSPLQMQRFLFVLFVRTSLLLND